MPMYDYDCPECGWIGEALASISTRDEQVCEDCGAKLIRVFAQGAAVIGATHSRPVDFSKQLGRKGVFETNAAARAHEKKMVDQGYQLVDKRDSTVRGWMDEISENRERTAQRLGFRNRDHQREVKRKERAKRQ